ncbi:MAG: hypothetical protein A2V45_05920 [Candidatus Aminicenantes bacterium RBG_19FT_COMBO_58_17]|nr:MAG: hypothetical protein A2V45_05920 [Candidatus Aminicenantes bacterium RBG_19FT_COMBO_58_17]
MNRQTSAKERGVTLIILVIVIAFLLAVGILVLHITGTGPIVAGNLRWQEQAFNAAEAGFDNAWTEIEGSFVSGWTNFDGHYITLPTGVNDPLDVNYFRKLTDEELLAAISVSDPNMIFYKIPYVLTPSGTQDLRYTFTAFLIDDEAGGGDPDPFDALLVCIGTVQTGDSVTTSRLEIGLAIESGT